jgi:hypothetical protein
LSYTENAATASNMRRSTVVVHKDFLWTLMVWKSFMEGKDVLNQHSLVFCEVVPFCTSHYFSWSLKHFNNRARAPTFVLTTQRLPMNIGIYKDVLEGEGWLNEHFLIFFEVAHFSTGQYFLWSFEPSQNASRAWTFLLIAQTLPKNIVISINFLEGKDWSKHLFSDLL